MDALTEAMASVLTLQSALALAAGVLLGIAAGILPGTGTTMSMAIVLGFAFTLDPTVAIPLAVGALVPNNTMDAVPAVMLGVPGSSSSQALILDGHALARQGRANQALATAYSASILGGLIGAAFLAALLPVARTVINHLGSPEFFAITLLGILLVVALSEGALLKGIIAGIGGILVGLIGLDISVGVERLTFGSSYLADGVPLVPFVLGLFAFPEFAALLVSRGPIADRVTADTAFGGWTQTLAGIGATFRHGLLMVRSSLVGAGVGIMPGLGSSVVDWLVYGQARSTVKGGYETFGKGDIRGVVAPSAADNSLIAAAFVPTIALGVPGSVAMAMFLGFLVLIGFRPGPEMLTTNVSITYSIIIYVALANIIAGGIGLLFSRPISRLAFVPPRVLVPVAAGLLSALAFLTSSSFMDLGVLAVLGVIGFSMKLHGWPRPPMLVGFVLASEVERFGRLTFAAHGWEVLSRPGLWVILLVATAVVLVGRRRRRQATKAQQTLIEEHATR